MTYPLASFLSHEALAAHASAEDSESDGIYRFRGAPENGYARLLGLADAVETFLQGKSVRDVSTFSPGWHLSNHGPFVDAVFVKAFDRPASDVEKSDFAFAYFEELRAASARAALYLRNATFPWA